ncbi:MAG: thiolase family protein [Planctomycetota bacterium]|nr:thiolase family protein [Planctomycetota bacterium]
MKSAIHSFARTPVAKAGRQLSTFDAVALASIAAKEALLRAGDLSGRISAAVFGTSRLAGQGPNPARRFALESGLDESVPAFTVTSACCSAFDALVCASRMIALGEVDAVLVGAAESMTRTPKALLYSEAGASDVEYEDLHLRDGLRCPLTGMLMAEIAEALARSEGQTRVECEEVALRSHRNYAAHRKLHEADIVAVETKDELLDSDPLVREEEVLARMPDLSPVFGRGGRLTPATICAVADGGAAAVLVRADLAPAAPVIAAHTRTAGPPENACTAAVEALKKLERTTGNSVSRAEHIEINEGFASQLLATANALSIDPIRVNPFGGALAIGHPTGMTPLRMTGLARRAILEGAASAVLAVPVSGGIGFALSMEAPK